MTELVTIFAGRPVTNSLVIADGTENQHKNVLELIRTYLADLEEFGRVTFETRPFETAGGTQEREVAILNEPQSTLLITFMRNSDIVRAFKLQLVRAFFNYAEQSRSVAVALPNFADPVAAARAWADVTEEKLKIEAQSQAQAQQLALAAPKVAFVENFVDARGLMGFREVAKLLKVNEARLREFLLNERIMYRLAGVMTAYQQHIDAGRFVVRAGLSASNDHAFSQAKFTPKGVNWIAGEWAKAQVRQEVGQPL